LDPGRGDYFRSRAAEAFGYPELALLAIEDALEKAPGKPAFVHQRLELLKTLDLDRGFKEARELTKQHIPAMIVAACASIYYARARQLAEADGLALDAELLEFTERFESSAGYDTAPRSVAAMVYVTRGFGFIRIGNRERAVSEFDRAVAANPDNAAALAARGLETYPEASAVKDLLRAVELGLPSFWPTYYLSHHYMLEADWSRAEEFAGAALAMAPPGRVRANLIEWQAIARFQQDGDVAKAREHLRRALALAPDNEHLQRNLTALEALAVPPEPGRWLLIRDQEKRTLDLAA
jgi:tetratricopeptide (TPR) repeat protein